MCLLMARRELGWRGWGFFLIGGEILGGGGDGEGEDEW